MKERPLSNSLTEDYTVLASGTDYGRTNFPIFAALLTGVRCTPADTKQTQLDRQHVIPAHRRQPGMPQEVRASESDVYDRQIRLWGSEAQVQYIPGAVNSGDHLSESNGLFVLANRPKYQMPQFCMLT